LREGRATKLEELTTGAAARGVVPDGLVTVVATNWFGDNALELTYKTAVSRILD
jgi:hypothetical protein